MSDGDNEEARLRSQWSSILERGLCKGYLLEVSRIPAKALYHAKKAAKRPKKPPALMTGVFGMPAALR